MVLRRSPNAMWLTFAVPMLCQRLTARSSTTTPLMAFGQRFRNAIRYPVRSSTSGYAKTWPCRTLRNPTTQ